MKCRFYGEMQDFKKDFCQNEKKFFLCFFFFKLKLKFFWFDSYKKDA